ncbi:MAG: bifunctional oligoribonuclease/PAP phosphatase NrnA [Tissierellia bacterium]|nr:bifunctional oligoribonuclease/PAP phosphatase NrnA [Tissierellia bacterium]
MVTKSNIDLFMDTINKANTISICSHISPDGDAIGSSTGLYLLLKEIGKEVYLIKNDEFPSNLRFVYNENYYTDTTPFETDLFILTDVAHHDRIGIGKEYKELAKDSLVIDHHQTDGGYCDKNLIVSTMSSTCQLITDLAIANGLNISKETATYLYLGMLTDTNRFLYDYTSADTLRTAAELLDRGADKGMIHLALYESMNVDYLLLQAEVIEKAKRFNDGKFILASLTNEQLNRYGLDHDETEGLVSIIKSIDGIELACLVKEHDLEDQKISFRSKDSVNVSELAKEFGGGGHIRAAGCTLLMTNEQAFDKMYERLKQL